MKLSPEQWDALSAPHTERFIHRMVEHLRDRFPEEMRRHGLSEAGLDPLVRRGISDAESYGIDDRQDVVRYLELLLVLGPRFDRDPAYRWAGNLLRQRNVDGGHRMHQLVEYVVFQVQGQT